jgi:predicted ArsR family transcriptional regulator
VNVEQVKQQWDDRLASTERKPRSDAAVFAALDLLPRHLALTSRILADELGISRKAALATLHRLSRVGILIEYGTVKRETSGQPASLFVSQDLLGLSGSSPLR